MVQSVNFDPSVAQYQGAIEFLDQRVDFERSQSLPSPQREFKLDRMRILLDLLDNPQDKLPIVHVAGTKGKGSTSAMIASVLCAAGYSTGLFTSPHLNRVEERINIDGQPCTWEEFADLVALIKPAVEQLDREGDGPTYFEILTAMALLHFVRRRVKAAVLEVGLGGRLDSTNVCIPRVCVITSISFDHTQQLGDSLAAIAREKAGIIKPGVPVVSGVTDEEAREVIRQVARDCACPLVESETDFGFAYHPPRNLEKQSSLGTMDFWLPPSSKSPLPTNLRSVPGEGQGEGRAKNKCATGQGATAGLSSSAENTVEQANRGTRKLKLGDQFEYHNISLSLLGRHQAANAAVALATLRELVRQGWNISEQAIRQGLRAVQWPARIEIVSRQPVVILDSAHNPASIAALVEVLGESFSAQRRLLLFATTRDKDYPAMLKLLVGGFDEIVFTKYTTNPRAIPPAELQSAAYQLTDRHFPVYNNPAEAWTHVRQATQADDLICSTGSFFFAGEMRKLM
jgi:dihydrofolate synthase/folylpolyglutamate synthase